MQPDILQALWNDLMLQVKVVYIRPNHATLRPKYPDICKQAGIEGTVVVSFWVDEAGIVDQSSIEILQSVPCLDQVCINEIKKSKWRPARQGRQKVGVPLSMPFNFTLEN